MLTLTESPQNGAEWQRIQRVITKLERPPASEMVEIQEAIRLGFQENFNTESAGGVPWAQLSRRTAIERLLSGYSPYHPILRRTGNYQSSWIDAINADHVSEIEYTGDGLILREGSEDERAAIHELGSGRVPARPVAVLSNNAEDEVSKQFYQWFESVINA